MQLAQNPINTEKLILVDRNKHIFLPYTDLVRIEGDGSYSTVYTKTHPPILMSQNLGSISPMLPAQTFFRIHQSHLINLNCVTALNRRDGYEVLLSDGSKVPVSRRKREALLELLAG